jgi:Protein of unknown function (DUF3306)
MAADEGDNFFSRWSRRKVQVRSGEPAPEPDPPAAAAPAAVVPAAVAAPAPAQSVATAPAPPPPTLEDTEALTPASDFSRFVAKDVSPEVRNAAVKKLFADPHFNVMDGLDIYIDDYSKPSPLSAADMAKMVSAQFLKLVEDPEEPAKKKAAAATDPVPQAAAERPGVSTPEEARAPDASAPEETHDDHADLQLQPDHAPGPQGPGPGAG